MAHTIEATIEFEASNEYPACFMSKTVLGEVGVMHSFEVWKLDDGSFKTEVTNTCCGVDKDDAEVIYWGFNCFQAIKSFTECVALAETGE